jgi:hypothetical protein
VEPHVAMHVSFRVGAEDAPYLVREFQERFAQVDFLQLPNYRIYLKLMIDGMPSKPFSAEMPAKGKNPVWRAKTEHAKSLLPIGRRFLPKSEQGASNQ